MNDYSHLLKMISKNTKKILNFILRQESLKNINQISKELKISVGSAFNILKDLESKDFIISENLGNAIYYKINFENKELIKILELILIEEKRLLKGKPKIYSNDLDKFDCSMILFFGSILKSNNFNDVDVLFLDCDVKKVSKFCLEISKVRSKPVVPLVLKRNDLVKEIKNKKKSILEIVKTAVVLKGELNFIEVIRDAKL